MSVMMAMTIMVNLATYDMRLLIALELMVALNPLGIIKCYAWLPWLARRISVAGSL